MYLSQKTSFEAPVPPLLLSLFSATRLAPFRVRRFMANQLDHERKASPRRKAHVRRRARCLSHNDQRIGTASQWSQQRRFKEVSIQHPSNTSSQLPLLTRDQLNNNKHTQLQACQQSLKITKVTLLLLYAILAHAKKPGPCPVLKIVC